ncbi:MAG: zinc metalloprotease [Gaiellaceae bacterium]
MAGVLAALSLTAAPASSAPAVASTLCNGWETPNSAYFTSLRALTTVASGARGGIGRGEPSLNANYAAATWFNARAGGDAERDMKKALHRGGFETLNVYTNLAGGYLGYAYLPGLPDARQYLDGTVIHWATVPGASDLFKDRYDLGHTLTHEVGHWVALEHTFAGGCNAKGDYVEDTPAMAVPTSGCPKGEGKDTCPKEPGLDPIENYMDYSYDSCYSMFTEGQADRAQDAWNLLPRPLDRTLAAGAGTTRLRR